MTRRLAKAIANSADIARVRSVLRENPRDFLLFELTIRTGAAMQHLLQLKVRNLQGLKPGDSLQIPVPGTNRAHHAVLATAVHRAYRNYLEAVDPDGDEYLFKSRKGANPLSIQSASRLVKKWFRTAGLSGMGGVMSLHQTWERHFRSAKPVAPGGDRANTVAVSRYDLSVIDVPSVQDAVYMELLRAIVSVKIPPGEKIVADRIARQMKVSRIPVREALKRLEAKGLVNTHKNRGTFAAELTLATFRELLKVRLVNEKIAARQAAFCHTTKTINKLEILHERYVSAWEVNKLNGPLFEINRDFHFTIYREANMPILWEVISYLWDRFSPYLYLMIDQTDVLSDRSDIDFHEGMIRGLQRSDPQSVCKWLEADMEDTGRILEKYFRLHQTLAHDSAGG